ncbi:MAG: hypothetical protein ABL997_12100 [Planctomycetota bacterium]
MNRLLEQFPLRRGAHDRRDDGMCAMEMVAWLAGEQHSDEPRCACPVIAAFVRAFNDLLPDDAARTRLLRPLVPRFVNTRGPEGQAQRRGFHVADASVRRLLPHLLHKQGFQDAAAALAALPPVTDASSARSALVVLDAVAKDQHATRWMLQRAIEGMAPERYVAGAMQLVRGAGDVHAFGLAAEIADELTRNGCERTVRVG